jgi:hypothetical protein
VELSEKKTNLKKLRFENGNSVPNLDVYFIDDSKLK